MDGYETTRHIRSDQELNALAGDEAAYWRRAAMLTSASPARLIDSSPV